MPSTSMWITVVERALGCTLAAYAVVLGMVHG
jgi:hypothetical protein